MASSGSFYTSTKNWTDAPNRCYVTWSQNGNTLTNTSTITYNVSVVSSPSGYVYLYDRSCKVYDQNGNIVLNKSASGSKKYTAGTTIWSGTFEVAHDASGTASIRFVISIGMTSSSRTSTADVTATLDSLDSPDLLLGVPQAYTINNTTQNTFSPYVNPDKARQYNLSYTLNGKTTTIWSMQSVSSQTFFTVDNADMLTAMNNVPSAVITFTLETYYGGEYVGTTYASSNITINLNNIRPYFPLLPTASPSTTPINGALVAGYSTAAISGTVVLATGNDSVVLKMKSISVGTVAADSSAITQSGTISLVTNLLPSNTSDLSGATAVVYLYDSRGAVSPDYTVTLPTIYGYAKPQITGNFYRTATNASTTPDEAGLYAYASFSATKSSVNNLNTLTVSCTYTGDSSGTATNGSWISLSEDGYLTFTVVATDSVTSSTATFSVPMAIFPLDLTQEYSGTGTTVGATVGGVAELGKFKSMLPSYFPNKAYGPGIIEYIRGTQASSTSTWTGDTDQDALYEGMTIMFFLPYDSTSNSVTLELTFPDNSSSGAVNVYYDKTNRMNNQFGAYSQILLAYHANYTINGQTYTGWWAMSMVGGGGGGGANISQSGNTLSIS